MTSTLTRVELYRPRFETMDVIRLPRELTERLDVFPQAIYDRALPGVDGHAVTFSMSTSSPRTRGTAMLPIVQLVDSATEKTVEGVAALDCDTSNPYQIKVRIPLWFWDDHPNTTVVLTTFEST